MHMRKQNNIICLLLTAIMLLSGMCYEKVHADSLFSYESLADNTSSMDSSDSLADNTVLLLGELFSQRNVITSIRHTRQTDERTGPRTDLYLSFVDALPHYSIFYSMAADVELYSEARSNTVIINFIHHKDGKK